MDSWKVFYIEESNFECGKILYDKATNDVGEVQQEVMCDKVETAKEICYLGNKFNASGECEATVTSRTRLGWKKLRECKEILFGKRFSLQERYKEA